MIDILKKYKGVDFEVKDVKDNSKKFDEFIELIKQKKEKEVFKSYGYTDEEMQQFIENLKKTKMYYWFFSLESIRNFDGEDGKLLFILNKEVLYKSFESSEEGIGLSNMIMNFISLNLSPDDAFIACKSIYGIEDKYSKIISDFYRDEYHTLQLNYIIRKITK